MALTELRIAVHRIIFLAAALAAIPALAQQSDTSAETECSESFKATDLNGDGVITHTEIAKAQKVPPALAKESLIGRNGFMAACAKVVAEQAAANKAEAGAAASDSSLKPAGEPDSKAK